MKFLMSLAVFACFAVGAGCGDGENGAEGGASCADACKVIAPCAGVAEATCVTTCQDALTQSQIACAAAAGSCTAANQCLAPVDPQPDVVSEDTSVADTSTPDTSTTPDTSSTTDTSTSPTGCFSNGRGFGCEGSAAACVYSISDQDGKCRNTITSCNSDTFPNVCDCMYDTIGDSVEGHALCSKGVSHCEAKNGRLYIRCK